MSRLNWSALADRYYEAGLDRGVLYPANGPAVPWNGLTGVDENGAESVTEFYMDGRPFLYLPNPKEFRATLRAYTYPDEFSEAMGLIEVTDGMYIDSQMGEMFGLSYRTMVGNALEGERADYKLHLIYNATVTPQGNSYATLSDTLTPSEFSWEIQATPVNVVGYRATAHIVIDTRHMDTTRIQAMEDLLYGTDTTEAALPDPSDLFNTVTPGPTDVIIITDNGDGTWTAEGSFANVFLIDYATFQINNVNAIGHGDGTFDISSTP